VVRFGEDIEKRLNQDGDVIESRELIEAAYDHQTKGKLVAGRGYNTRGLQYLKC